jgi:hypothetical protein
MSEGHTADPLPVSADGTECAAPAICALIALASAPISISLGSVASHRHVGSRMTETSHQFCGATSQADHRDRFECTTKASGMTSGSQVSTPDQEPR